MSGISLQSLTDQELNDYYAMWYQAWGWLLVNQPRWTGKIKAARKKADGAMGEYRRRRQPTLF